MSGATWLLVLVAGASGAVARYLLDGAVQDRTGGLFPWGTLTVNLTGCLVLGLVTGLALQEAVGSDRIVIGTGFSGAFTTFSTFSFETVRLAEEGAWADALRNLCATLGGGALAAGIGLAVTTLV